MKLTLSALVKILIEEFISDIHHKYQLKNYKTSSTYRSYNDVVPPYLHDCPRSVILHCLERKSNSRKFNVEDVLTQDQQNGIFTIKGSSENIYTVNFGGLLENHLVHASIGPSGISLASTFLLYSGYSQLDLELFTLQKQCLFV